MSVNRAAHAAVAEYDDDIYAALRTSELERAPSARLVASQPEISWEIRPQLLEFLMQAKGIIGLSTNTYMLAVTILDRYASKRVIFARHYQLVGIVALWLAAKVNDDKHRVPTVGDLAYLCAATFPESTFGEMEFHMIASLDWCVLAPTTADFIGYNLAQISRRSVQIRAPEDYELCSKLASYMCECALFDEQLALSRLPSAVAASAVALSMVIVDALGHHNRPFVCPEDCTRECFDALAAVISTPPQAVATSHPGLSAAVARFFAAAAITTVVGNENRIRAPQLSPLETISGPPDWGLDSPSSASAFSDSPRSFHMPRTPDDDIWPNAMDKEPKSSSFLPIFGNSGGIDEDINGEFDLKVRTTRGQRYA